MNITPQLTFLTREDFTSFCFHVSYTLFTYLTIHITHTHNILRYWVYTLFIRNGRTDRRALARTGSYNNIICGVLPPSSASFLLLLLLFSKSPVIYFESRRKIKLKRKKNRRKKPEEKEEETGRLDSLPAH